MTEKIKEYRIKIEEAQDASISQDTTTECNYRYFNAFTPDEAIKSELSVRIKEGNLSLYIHLEEYNPYADKWGLVAKGEIPVVSRDDSP